MRILLSERFPRSVDLDPERKWEVLKTSVRMMRSVACYRQERVLPEIGIQPNYLSTMERGKVEIGAEILLRISREFVKSVEWLLTGEG